MAASSLLEARQAGDGKPGKAGTKGNRKEPTALLESRQESKEEEEEALGAASCLQEASIRELTMTMTQRT